MTFKRWFDIVDKQLVTYIIVFQTMQSIWLEDIEVLLRRSYGLMDRHKYSFNKWSFCSVKISFSILSEIQNSWWSWTIYIYYNLVLLKTNVEVIILQHFHIFHSETSHSSLVSLSSLREHTFSSVPSNNFSSYFHFSL